MACCQGADGGGLPCGSGQSMQPCGVFQPAPLRPAQPASHNPLAAAT